MIHGYLTELLFLLIGTPSWSALPQLSPKNQIFLRRHFQKNGSRPIGSGSAQSSLKVVVNRQNNSEFWARIGSRNVSNESPQQNSNLAMIFGPIWWAEAEESASEVTLSLRNFSPLSLDACYQRDKFEEKCSRARFEPWFLSSEAPDRVALGV
jgi:hypothetical protein